ncbi:hypothetical protein [Luteimonas sp. MC1572]|uniref:hypothetical protein n=1 Tax=Luteimonas sp. MC1572 TaxID=2799325 RepID=UPI0018F0B7E7|nr:hypothetical protein [Luteimonas sp. MC1572]MBJ6982030.1 hypothetical protein [Luteimonas sp. MC1572]QQO03328.1 hypothetical protein JGR64_00645 [Luteimonas sp. MC1572]
MSRITRYKKRPLAMLVAAAISTASLSAQAFDVPVHIRITRDQLAPLRAEIDGREKGFSEKALEQIASANEDVDSITTRSAALFKPERHFTNEQYGASSQRLLALRQEVIELATADTRAGTKARERLGQALHTLQDFYGHSNWVERGNTGINHALGTTTLPNPAAASVNCPANPNVLGPAGGGTLTSAYFVGFTLSRENFGCDVDELPANKCFHGNYRPTCIGINKDLDATGAAQNNVPMNPHHPAAATQAREATRVFVQGILDDLAGNDRALAALLDVRGTLGFVVDDTGSMGSSITGVVGTINQIVTEVDANPELSPDNYLLVRYGDPDVGSAFVTEDAAALRSAVAGLSPAGGGDCPELSQSALINAIDAAASDSRIYLFTDATAKDSGAMNQVIARAQAKGTELNYGLTGSCSPIDPAYVRGAAETGGQVFRVFPSQIPLLYTVIRPQLEGDLNTIVRRRVDLGTGGSEHIFAPVDSTVTGLLVAVTVVENDVAAGHMLRVFRPSGAQVSASDPDAHLVTLAGGTLVRIDAPESGEWRVEVEGHGPFTATVQGNSSIDLARVDFVAPGGDIHGGFGPIAGQPVAGVSDLVEATMAGPYANAVFHFVDEAGNALGGLDLVQSFPTADPSHFLGEAELPAVPFRVVATGEDSSSLGYRREYPTVYRAQPLAIELDGIGQVELVPGATKTIAFSVTNHGTRGTYSVVASDELGFTTSVQPSSLALAPGEEAEVRVTVSAPADAVDGASSTVVLTATRVGQPEVFNSASTVVTVLANQGPTCPASTAQTLLWPPNGKLHALSITDLAGATDPDGDALAFVIDAILQDEPVHGSGDRTAPDASGIGGSMASVRAERRGNGDGRVYEVRYTASDAKGGACSGSVMVGVPHSRGNEAAIDSGERFDSTTQ